MGKIRAVSMGDQGEEKEQKRRAEARRETKKSKKIKPSGISDHKTQLEKTEEQKTETEKEIKKRHMRKGKGRTRSLKYNTAKKLVDPSKDYSLKQAVELIKKTSYTKFDGTVELHVTMNVEPKDKNKIIRGSVTLPHGTGRQTKVAIASEAILKELENGKINFDILVAEPTIMPKLAKYAKLLGPKGLMPNPKSGTVTTETEKRAKELAGGKTNYKSEPENPIIHMAVGKVSFSEIQLIENIQSVIKSFNTNGKVKKASIAATMGPGIRLGV